LRAVAAGASFSPVTGAALGGPVLGGGYAFPVGGGASSVSVSAGHHDYPAVDIAAPAGAAVFALGSGIVERAWRQPDPRCGVGLLLRTTDGRGWVYCHLAMLEPGVAAGLRVSAGDPLGLVGATGEATGPHLHLQFEHADAWPQREPWLVALAGAAFRWQEAPPTATGSVSGGSVDVVLFH
jgi:murein DD-endopeptidase MepM/ murein hydrolase activator NlpD